MKGIKKGKKGVEEVDMKYIIPRWISTDFSTGTFQIQIKPEISLFLCEISHI
jgi:hypothetical protein